MNIRQHHERDITFLELFLKARAGDISEAEVRYFQEHPNQIDEVSAPVNIHLLFLWTGGLLGAAVVAVSKWLKFSQILDFLSESNGEFVIDIVFEIGVALIGAAVTAYVLGILLNQQQENATKWRVEIRRRIEELEG